jgi:hypothetical protein
MENRQECRICGGAAAVTGLTRVHAVDIDCPECGHYTAHHAIFTELAKARKREGALEKRIPELVDAIKSGRLPILESVQQVLADLDAI